MRIVAGKYRGKKLKEFDLETTKPTLDRVKVSMFNLIQFDILDSVVCDLFSGTGALGIETISRGAKKVYLIDNNKKALKIIKENLNGIEGNFKVCEQSYENFLNTIDEKFDLFLIDPPYASDFGIKSIDLILKRNLLKIGGIIMFETSKENNFTFDEEIFEVDKRNYGTVSLYKLTRLK